MIDDEKKILSEDPDYETQLAILEEEYKQDQKKKRWYTLIGCLLVFIVAIFVISYSSIHVYREYGDIVSNNACENVNLRVNGSPVPNLNIYIAKDGDQTCKAMYNIDYHNNRVATFNIDVYGDQTFIFNETNQLDETGSYCILNCDANNDGWPDYNLDLDGNGTADINIVSDPQNSTVCDKNCDINDDTIPDYNVEKDGVVLNQTDENGDVKYNITYKHNLTPMFNINKGNGNIENPINVMQNGVCVLNCDIDYDGFPDYNIRLSGKGDLLNELIASSDENTVVYSNHGDWKCHQNSNLDSCHKTVVGKNVYINIDVDGDGVPDVNISNNKGKKISNPIDNNGLNIDIDEDGFPDYNIDINGDGIADMNIANENNVCIKNCDYNNDGKVDYYVEKPNSTVLYSIDNINIDINFDGICDVNCDKDGDLIPDYNIDTNGDILADINIDYDGDKNPDFNVDSNNDGKPDQNIDVYGVGVCNFNCNGNYLVNSSNTCTENCDTNNDGMPDKFVDVNHDGICDFNCGNNDTKDEDNNYYLDSIYPSESSIISLAQETDANVYILNPLNIKGENINPGWSNKYVIEIRNESFYGIKYNLTWENIINEFTDINNLDYFITRNRANYLNDLKAPRANGVIASDIIKSKTAVKYVVEVSWKETGINQNIDAGKTFKGNLQVRIVTK